MLKLNRLHRIALAVAVTIRCGGSVSADVDPARPPPSWRSVNPDMLSGGLFAALDADGIFGPRPQPPRARAVYADLSKGRPPAVLDARVGVNLRVGDDPDALPATQRGQAEPHLVRSTANPDVLLATFQDGRLPDSGAVNCGYSLSRDGGLTWSRALIPNLTTSTGGRFNRATDPVAGAGPQGDLYLQTLVSVQGNFQLAAVVVSRSTDGGVTWPPPATVFESASVQLSPDKNWLAVNDYASAPNFGRLVSTWTNFNRNSAGGVISTPIVASVSDDRGVTWTTPVNITPDGSLNQSTQPVFLPDGSMGVVYIAFLNPQNTAQFSIQYKRSSDGGRTFPANATTVAGSVNGFVDPVVRAGVFLPSATVARSTGQLFVTYIGMVGDSPRVLVTRSSDQGATWSAATIASDQPARVSVLNPAIAVTPDGRSVSVVFMDKRHAPDGRNFVDHYAALSFDGGATWQPNIRLTEMSSDVRYGPLTSGGVMLGDYMGLAPSLANDQPCVAIWCDTRTGDSDPFTVRFVPSATADFRAWSIARGTRSDFFSDRDSDGEIDAIEYASGSDPLQKDHGDDLVLTRSGVTTFDVAWTQRAIVSFDSAGLNRTSVLAQADPDFSRFPTATSAFLVGQLFGSVALSADQLPGVTPRPGLTWTGRRYTIPPGTPVAVGRTMLITLGAGDSVKGPMSAMNTDSRLTNLSTRGHAGIGESQMIVGFVIDGNKSILIRAAGPALSALGIRDTLANPQLTLSAAASDVSRTNDNWQQSAATPALFARLGAFPFAANALDSALVLELGAQSFTAIVSGVANGTGIALAEVYDADPTPGAPTNPRLLNLSTRADVGAGENALIVGFVLSGTQPRRVLIRAVGPTLMDSGVTGIMNDPMLTLFQGNTRIAVNDDWEISRSGAAIAATAQRVGAFPLKAASLDAALLITLAPGAYTAVVTSADGGIGLALVEIYDAD